VFQLPRQDLPIPNQDQPNGMRVIAIVIAIEILALIEIITIGKIATITEIVVVELGVEFVIILLRQLVFQLPRQDLPIPNREHPNGKKAIAIAIVIEILVKIVILVMNLVNIELGVECTIVLMQRLVFQLPRQDLPIPNREHPNGKKAIAIAIVIEILVIIVILVVVVKFATITEIVVVVDETVVELRVEFAIVLIQRLVFQLPRQDLTIPNREHPNDKMVIIVAILMKLIVQMILMQNNTSRLLGSIILVDSFVSTKLLVTM
jgi:hypothetical protein